MNDKPTYLVHAQSGVEWKKHKYVKKIDRGNKKPLYFYTLDAYKAYLKTGKVPSEKGSTAQKATEKIGNNKTVQDTKKAANQKIDQVKKLLRSISSQSTKRKLSELSKDTIESGKQAVAKVVNASNKVAKETTKKVKKASKEVTEKVESTAKEATTKANKLAKETTNKATKVAKDVGKKAEQQIDKTKKLASKTISEVTKTASKQLNDAKNSVEKSLKNVGNEKMGSDKVKGLSAVGVAIVAAAIVAVAKIAIEVVKKLLLPESEITVEYSDVEVNKRAERANHDTSNRGEEDPDHPGFYYKKNETSSDDDMLAVNSENGVTPEKYDKMVELTEAYNDAYARGDYDEMNRIYEEYYDIYDSIVPGALDNCADCTLTYDFRRRGYDVVAPVNQEGTTPDTIFEWYGVSPKDVTVYTSDGTKKSYADGLSYDIYNSSLDNSITNDIKNDLNKYPDGAYGQFNLYWSEGGGHSVVWEKENGEIYLRDCQTGKKVDMEEYTNKSSAVFYFRTDNLDLSDLAYETMSNDEVGDDGRKARKW